MSLQKRVDLFEGKPVELRMLDVKGLDDLEMKLQESVRSVQHERERKLEDEYKCRVCLDHRKNVYFVDGCDHVEICGECESTTEIKQCPRCATPYSKCKVLNLY